MAGGSDNKTRAFSDVVTVDAWHQPFSETGGRVDLHADVVFGTARIGAEKESPVRFRLSLRQAELIVVVPELEPISVDVMSVSRDAPDTQGRVRKSFAQEAQGRLGGGFAVTVSPAAPSASMSASAEATQAVRQKSDVELTSEVTAFVVTHSQTSEGHHRWRLEPIANKQLVGRPWKAAEAPRLTLVDERDGSHEIAGAVRVEVRCRREDLLIEDLALKDQTVWDSLKGQKGEKNRMAAAISYIRDRLVETGLEFDSIEDPFGVITLSSVIAQETR
ncbi:hypothetical protein [Vitreimonas sp.]|uniref:hypothetical protein n=1 Tax=Vitreimonas sp. TaxID=3069702 RepID=UPI002D7A0E7A|nr:hypothetical protein [Vitreimonas sp.]